jgi:LmbE family N-acetylglucosaminyl deacetylase
MTVERNLSVVAHEDDDLIFLNPAIVQGIRRDSPTQTVYVTAGEFNGNGTTRAAYAGQRRDGECSAYASTARVPDEWTRTVMVAGGHEVESSVLNAAPHVELLFLGLPDGGDDQQPHAVPGCGPTRRRRRSPSSIRIPRSGSPRSTTGPGCSPPSWI